MTTTATDTRNAHSIQALNEHCSHQDPHAGRVQALASDMAANGWVGAPILTWGDLAVTGTHRIAAARIAEVDVPVIDLIELADDGDAIAAYILQHADTEAVYAGAEALALLIGRDEAHDLGLDVDDPATQQALVDYLDVQGDEATLASIREDLA